MRRNRLLIIAVLVLAIVGLTWFLIDRTVIPRMATADATNAFKAGNYKLVEEKASIAIRKYPTSNNDRLTPLVFRADARLELNKPAEALEDAEEVLRMVPDHKAGTFYRGVARYKLGQYKESEADLRAVLAKDDESTHTNYYLGLIAERRGDWEYAWQFYRAAVQEFYLDDEEPTGVFAKKFAALSRVCRVFGDTNSADEYAAIATKLKKDVSFEIE